MRSAEQEADVTAYVEAVDAVLTDIPKEEKGLAMHDALSSLLVLNNPGIGAVDVEHQGQLDRGARYLAEDVLKTHPDSKDASEVFRFGINSPLRIHRLHVLDTRFSIPSHELQKK